MPNMPRKRAVNVCEFCHNHKIRCDVDLAGVPCAKCREIGEKCSIRARKQYLSRARAQRRTRAGSRSSRNEDDHSSPTQTPPLISDPVEIVAAAISEPSSRIAPIFVEKGGYGAILSAVGGTTDRHFHIPTTAEKALAVEDLHYLKAKGCLTLPAETPDLIRAYFQFVHPTFPVIDGQLFLHEYAAKGHEGINLLLLWSMFSISASYIPISPQKWYKEIYAQRAKLLFDLSHESDKIVLVQSALLLSFWFADTEDVKQSWYWTSIAFSIAQTIGLHRRVGREDTQVSARQRRLWRNIWQCCMIRDVWLAFGMGRPLRLKESDCKFPMTDEEKCDFSDLAFHGEDMYSSAEANGFASMWQDLVITSNDLRDIITSEKLSTSQSKSFRDREDTQSTNRSTFLLTHVDRHLKLHKRAANLALARVSGSHEDVRKAAERTTAIIKAFLHEGVTIYSAPVVIPLLVPAMATYLTAIKSKDPETRKRGKENLDFYSSFLAAVEEIYPAASILKRVIGAAENAIIHGEEHSRKNEKTELSSVNRTDFTWGLHPWLEELSGELIEQ